MVISNYERPWRWTTRDGFEFTVIVNPTPTTRHPPDQDLWQEEDDDALLAAAIRQDHTAS